MTKVALVELKPGKLVSFQGKVHRIRRVNSLENVELLDDANQAVIVTKVDELQPAEQSNEQTHNDLQAIGEAAWAVAQKRYDIIKPLLDKPDRTREDVATQAAVHSVHTNTVYGWLRAYEQSGLRSSLLPKTRSDKGAAKLTPEVEKIIREVIESEYLTKQKKSQQKVCDEVRKHCLRQNLPVPHGNSVRNRIKQLQGELVAARRLGRKTADLSYKPHEGSFPGADYPLAVVQIDHTKLDIILVDDHYRQPIGRPWITLAFDVCTRVVTGFYVSFDPPSALSTGLCLTHAILTKDKWLTRYPTQNQWLVWGLPAKVHLDNAKEFRGSMMQRGCDEYGIDLEWRPVGRPNFGAHVERALGSFAQEIHTLPGTTFSNPREKGEYDSEGKAALTLSEFEQWLTIYIVDVYHQKIHSSLGMSPAQAWQRGILGSDKAPGSGLPAKIADEFKLRLDLMPFELRAVLDYGVQIDKIHYYSDVLRVWINAPDPNDSKRKRKFMFRRDPRDLSQIWFYDPELATYYAIPYRNLSHPPISIWELREARKRAEDAGVKEIDEQAIFDAYDRMREIETTAVKTSKAVRRMNQRRKTHQLSHSVIEQSRPDKPEAPILPAVPQDEDAEFLPFDELDEL
ncbi:Mu transposase C-terminal domain-containing protein [Rheinheimera aquimaris]|uniref:Mu transposase C-terminal domain-containing protein n=1 Tax=Rheinheimera aquimaris TaxID=412437 RepID=UPI003A976EEE